MTELRLNIEVVVDNHKIPYNLLKLADPSITQIESYLRTGTCYVAKFRDEVLGVMVLDKIDATTLEIKNIAIKECQQRKGYGRELLRHSEKIGKRLGCEKLIIGTGNSSINQLALYQKEGFEIDRIEKNFFTNNYCEPIYENGIQCKHMIFLEKKL